MTKEVKAAHDQAESEFSEEKGNLKIMESGQTRPPAKTDGDQVVLGRDGLKVRSGGNLIIGKLNLVIEPLRNRHERFYRGSKFHLLADLVLLALMLASLGYFVWAETFSPKKEVFLESKLTSLEAQSGGSLDIELTYGNLDGEDLGEAAVRLDLPRNFLVTSAEPSEAFNGFEKSFRIKNLSSGVSRTFKLSGVPVGVPGERQTVYAFLDYRKDGKKHNVLNSLDYELADSALKLEAELAKEAFKGSVLPLKLKLKNAGGAAMEKIELNFAGPWRFRRDNEYLESNSAMVENLRAGEEREIDLEAAVESDQPEAEFKLDSYLVLGEGKYRQLTIQKKISVRQPKFSVSITGDKRSMKLGDEIGYLVKYQNQEEAQISQVRLRLISGNRNYNLTQVRLTGKNQATLADDFVMTLPDLAQGSSGEIGLTVRFDRRKIEANQELSLAGEVEYLLGNSEVRYQAVSAKTRLETDFLAAGAAYYYSPQGDQLGVGPLPPVVDIPTSYWVFFQAENAGNDLKDFSLTAELPEGVIWTGKKSVLAGSLYYGEVGRTLIWSIDDVAGTGDNNKVGFEVQIVPQEKDIGRTMVLVEKISYSARDSFIGRELKGTLANLDTNLSGDPLGRGKGRVQK